MTEAVDDYWFRFLASLPSESERPARYADVFSFGTRPEGAREIAALVLAGVKTATGSLLWTYEEEGKPLPQPGDLSIVTDGDGAPLCVIETTDVRVIPYAEVGEEYAWAGGEGDRGLVFWRRIYWDYIVSECARLGRQPSKETPLVMERFRLVFPAQLPAV